MGSCYRYVPPQRVWFSRRFGLKTGVVIEGTTGVYERFLSFQFQMNKIKRETCDFEMDSQNLNFFLERSNLRNVDMIS